VNHREFVEWIYGIETDCPVTSWTIRGIHVWPLVRLSLSYSALGAGSPAHSLGAGWGRLGLNVGRGLAGWAHAHVSDRRANQRPADPADAIFLVGSIGRRPLVDGKRYDVRAGPYIELLSQLGARSLVWEMSPYGDHNVPRHTPSFLVQPHLMALRGACQVLPLGHDMVALERYEEFLERVREAGLRFPHADVHRLRRDVLFLRRLADKFTSWLRGARPRLGFVANTALPEQAFCLACRELGITSVEVQHGVQGDFHPSYGSWHALPPSGWETRARIFWNWDKESAEAINRWAALAPDHHVAIHGGDPWREGLAGHAESNHGVERLIEERKLASGKERHILVTLTSQGEAVPAAVLEAVRSSPSTWCFWFRLHPVDQSARRKEARRLLAPLGVDVALLEFATETPLHALLRQMDAHFSVGHSTVVSEAAMQGVPSVASSPQAAHYYRAEMDSGMLLMASTPVEIVGALQRILAMGRRPAVAEHPRAVGALQRLLAGDLPTPR
jgi:hypothetical protein